MSCELKKEWFKELQVLAVSMCLTTLMAFLHIDALSDKLFIYTNLFDLIYCIVGLVNVLRWAFSRDKALAMASKDEKTRSECAVDCCTSCVCAVLRILPCCCKRLDGDVDWIRKRKLWQALQLLRVLHARVRTTTTA